MAGSFCATFGIAKAIDGVLGLRVTEDDETIGLDRRQHSETAYSLGVGGARVVRQGRLER